MQEIPTLVTFIQMLHPHKIRMGALIGRQSQLEMDKLLDLNLQGGIATASLIRDLRPSQELTELVRRFSNFSVIATMISNQGT